MQFREAEAKLGKFECSPVSLDVIFEHHTRTPEPEELSDARVQSTLITEETGSLNPLQELESPSPAPACFKQDSRYLRLYEWIQSRARITAALVKRNMLSEISYRFSFFMQITEIFFTIAALYFLSRLIGQNTINQYLAPYGGNYFAFAIIGVAFYSYFDIGFTSFATQLREAQTTGTLEAMLSTPAGLSIIVLGSSLWAFIMATLRVIVILLSGALLLDSGMTTSNVPLALLILLLTVASASSFGIVAASFIMVVKRGDPISWLFRSASWLLGGVVFPVTILPIWMQKLALLLPTTHALRAMRLALLQGKSMSDVLPEISALCVFCFLLLPVSLRVLKYAVRRAKQEGTLTHY